MSLSDSSSRPTWIVWTFALFAMPSIARDFGNPVVPGQMGPIPVALTIIGVIVAYSATRQHFSSFLSGQWLRWFIRLCGLSGVSWAAANAASWSLGYETPPEQPCLTALNELLFTIEPLLETLTMLGWVLMTLREHGGSKGRRTSEGRSALLLLAGLLWPFAMISIGEALPNGGIFEIWGLLVCLASGIAAVTFFQIILKSGISVAEVTAFLCGLSVCRCQIEVFNQVLYLLPDAKPVLVILFLVCAALAFLLILHADGGLSGDWRLKKPASDSDEQELQKRAAITRALQELDKKNQLSPRERDTLARVALGQTSEEIAVEYKISKSTVGSYRKRGYDKLGLKGRDDLFQAVSRLCGDSRDTRSDTTDRQADASDSFRSKWARLLVTLLFIALPLFQPPDNVPLFGARYWFNCVGPACLGAGSTLCVLGLLRWSYQISHRQEIESMAHNHNENVARIEVIRGASSCLASVGTGYLVSRAWASAPLFNIIDVMFLVNKLGALLGVLTLLAFVHSTSGVGFNRAPSAKSLPVLLARSVELTILSRPQLLLLFGLGIQSFQIDVELGVASSVCTGLAISSCLVVWVLILSRSSALRKEPAMPSRDIETLLQERGLSQLQARVIVMSMDGSTTREICSSLHIAPGTVRSYRSRALSHLAVKSLSELQFQLNSGSDGKMTRTCNAKTADR